MKPQDVTNAANLPSLDVAFDLARERTASQLETVDALDAKANFILTSASVVVATSIAVGGIASAMVSQSWVRVVRILPLFLVALAYIAVVILVYQAYKVRGYERAPKPRILLDDYLHQSDQTTKEDMVRALADVYDTNAHTIESKALWTNRALQALVVQSILLAVGILLQAII